MTFNPDKNFSKSIGKYNKIINLSGLRGRPYIDSIVSSYYYYLIFFDNIFCMRFLKYYSLNFLKSFRDKRSLY